MKIAFFGTPRLAQIVLEKLIDSPYKPQLVITAPDARVVRGQKNLNSPVKETALKNSIEVIEPRNFDNFDAKFDLAILIGYGKILPQKILEIPKFGFINIHPSLLPKYRGPSPVQSAILNDEEKTGVTIMLLDEEIDHGPILAQQEIKIENEDNNETLHEKLGGIGAELLIEILPRYLAHLRGVQSRSKAHLGGEISGARIFIPPKPQVQSKATFTKHIKKQDGYINPESPPGKGAIDRMIRAYYPWPGVHAKLMVNGKWLIVKFLPKGKIQPEGKRVMSIKEFLNGYPKVKNLIENLV